MPNHNQRTGGGHPSGKEYRAPQQPEDRMGVFKKLADVPPRYRLGNQNPDGFPADPWDEFMAPKREKLAESTLDEKERAYRYFAEFMDDVGRHPALADPQHVENFLADLGETRSRVTLFSTYFVPLNNWFKFLRDHAEYPHVYAPSMMAAAEWPNGATRSCWEYRNDRADRAFYGDGPDQPLEAADD